MSLIKAFNNLLSDFLSDLRTAFPNESHLITFATSIDLLSRANPKEIPVTFMKYILPFETQIENCDTDFFLRLGEGEQESELLSKGLRLKELWLHKDTTDHTKACIIGYMQKLLKLGKMVTR